jgi:hypothetical protein
MIITARIAIATALSSAISSSEVRALKGWWITRLFQNRVWRGCGLFHNFGMAKRFLSNPVLVEPVASHTGA